MPNFANIDNVSQVPECVSCGEPGSGTISPESGNVMAMSDFAGDIDPKPGEPFLPSGVHLDMSDFADISSKLIIKHGWRQKHECNVCFPPRY